MTGLMVCLFLCLNSIFFLLEICFGIAEEAVANIGNYEKEEK